MKQKIVALLMACILCLSAASCGQTTQTASTGGDNGAALKIALILPGTVNDKGWSSLALSAIEQLHEELGAEIKYSESVKASDCEQVFRGYASQGYHLIIGHGYEFSDAAAVVAKDYPNTYFCISNGTKVAEPNLSATAIDNTAFGFLLGATCAVLSENKNIGLITGTDNPPMKQTVAGFEAGARYIEPKIQLNMVYSGTLEDAAKVKENALSVIDKGVDVLSQNADHASLGAITACEERGVMNVGAIGDQLAAGPNSVVVNVMQDLSQTIVAAGHLAAQGKLEAKEYRFGIAEKAIYLSDFTGVYEDRITEEKKAGLRELSEQLAQGKIDVNSLAAEASAPSEK